MRRFSVLLALLLAAMLLGGCTMRTAEQMYAVPKRSNEYRALQTAIDGVMDGPEYASPLSGENRQTVQMADLDGDGTDEYLLFAKSTSDAPLKIFIFTRAGEEYVQLETIESQGSAFDLIEYADMDGAAGTELIVGRQVSDQVPRFLAVYSFAGGRMQQLMSANYSRFLTCDLDQDGLTDLMVLSEGASEEENAVASLYRHSDGALTRSREARLSRKSEQIKRIMVSRLHGGRPAVYIASTVDEDTIVTDVFALTDGALTNVSLSSETGTSVQTLRNYYVYAVDIDADGTPELPSLIDMQTVQNSPRSAEQHLIRWYAMTEAGGEVDKLHTFHNFDGGWYLTLEKEWAQRVSVTQEAGVTTFYVWDASYEKAEKLLSIYALSGANRESAAQEDERFPIYQAEGVTYAAKLEVAALSYGLTQGLLQESFHLIHMDWKTGET